MAKFGAILTNYGLAAVNRAFLTGRMVNCKFFALGDAGGGYYQPAPEATSLKNEKWRTTISHGEISDALGTKVTFYAVVPPELDGFTIREMAVFDEDNKMVAICNTPEIEKVAFEEGVAQDALLAMEIEVVHAEVLKYEVDPYITIATLNDIEQHNKKTDAHPDIRGLFDNYYKKKDTDALLLNKANINDLDGKLNKDNIQVNKLPLSASTTGYVNYWKNSFDEVNIIFELGTTLTQGFCVFDVLATLPSGFRPSLVLYVPTVYKQGTTLKPGLFMIPPSGAMQCYEGCVGMSRLYGALTITTKILYG